jgi:hypothetical protein
MAMREEEEEEEEEEEREREGLRKRAKLENVWKRKKYLQFLKSIFFKL